MTRLPLFAAAATVFVVLATANSGGYRYGVSDQAFYIPAIALERHPDLFPRDRALLEPQMHLWAGGRALATITSWTGDDPPPVFLVIYGLTLVTLAAAALALARGIGCSWWASGAFLFLLTLRHRIAKTGANSLEGYMHPRMLAFAVGLGSLAALVRNRRGLAFAIAVVSVGVHTTTGAWFMGMLILAAMWEHRRRPEIWIAAIGTAIVAAVALFALAPNRLEIMDSAWLGVLAEKDYLFPAEWPAYAWVTNLAYPLVIYLLYRQRQRRGLLAPGESALVASAIGLTIVFLVSVPLAEARIALAVQLQVNRVFWLLDGLVAMYIAWWLTDGLATATPARARDQPPRSVLIAVSLLALLATGRGVYVLAIEARRPLVQMRQSNDAWVDVMTWLSTQPASWHVLADPAHGWKYGSSVRVAALRDTVLESGKDSAMAMYDRGVAKRVAERTHALEHFDDMSVADVRRLDAAYSLDVFVDRTERTWDLPVLYKNDRFAVYDLR